MDWTSHMMIRVSLCIRNVYVALVSLVKHVLGFVKLSFFGFGVCY